MEQIELGTKDKSILKKSIFTICILLTLFLLGFGFSYLYVYKYFNRYETEATITDVECSERISDYILYDCVVGVEYETKEKSNIKTSDNRKVTNFLSYTDNEKIKVGDKILIHVEKDNIMNIGAQPVSDKIFSLMIIFISIVILIIILGCFFIEIK
jgi:hypothetical protein